jgi:hypothetical protein
VGGFAETIISTLSLIEAVKQGARYNYNSTFFEIYTHKKINSKTKWPYPSLRLTLKTKKLYK